MGAVFEGMRHRLTVDDFHKMAAGGIFMEDDRVELIDGEMVDMAPIGSRHASVVTKLLNGLAKALGEQAIVKVQDPLRLGPYSEPEPDLMLLKPRDDFYAAAHPGSDDVLLLIEVSDTSGRFDREVKLPLYARHGVAEVWMVDLESCTLEICTEPNRERGIYGERRTVTEGAAAPRAFPACSVQVEPLFP